MKKKQAFTLLEIMIVILLIGLIGSVIGYNMKGSLDKGKVFKTERAAEQLRDFLLLEIAKGNSVDYVIQNAEKCLREENIAKDVKALLNDGWGEPFVIAAKGKGDIKVTSKRLSDYYRKKNKALPEDSEWEED